jgi:uncharacterized protein (TIGR02246 family)
MTRRTAGGKAAALFSPNGLCIPVHCLRVLSSAREAAMQKDDHAIRALIERWMHATREGDYETVAGLMAEDMLFMTPGREPFGRDEFLAGADAMKDTRIEGAAEVHEVQVHGDFAFARTFLDIVVFPPGGKAGSKVRGFTLGIFKRDSHGNWLLYRDANMVMPAT